MRPEDIIIKPIITEESNAGLQEGKYTFKVNKKATKVDIANAVEKLFEVKVLKVNTITVKGKEKRVGRNVGKTPFGADLSCTFKLIKSAASPACSK